MNLYGYRVMQLSYSKNVISTEMIIQLVTSYVNILILSLFIYLFKKNEINDRITRNDSKMRGRYGKENIYSRKT